MKIAGSILFITGAFCALASFLMPTAVDSSSDVSMFRGTLNLGLLQSQMMVLHVGLSGFIAGAVLIGAGEIAERLGHWTGSQAVVEVSPPAATGVAPEVKLAPIAESDEWTARDNLAVKIVLGMIGLVLLGLLYIWFSNHPQPTAASSASDADNLAAEADQLANEANALVNKTRP
jgi:hypothetical protein